MNIVVRFFIIIAAGFVLAGHANNDNPFFKCLNDQNFDCLVQEAINSDEWKYEKTTSGESALRVAITQKNHKIIKTLINFGAPVTSEDVIFAMSEFFDVDPGYFARAKSDDALAFLSIIYAQSQAGAKDMIKALNFAEGAHDAKILAKTIDLFCSRSNLSLYIAGALHTQEILPVHGEQLLRHYSDLFLQGQRLPLHSLKKIVKHLIAFNLDKYLLQLVTEAHAIAKPTRMLATIEKPRFDTKKDRHQRAVALAIMEKSRSDFSKFSLKDLVRQKILGRKKDEIVAAENFQNDLMDFVSASILFPVSHVTRLRHYEFWHQIYQVLLRKGDLSSATSLAIGLNNSEVSRKIPKQYQKPQELSDIERNFRGYRKFLSYFKGEFRIPSLAVIGRDLTFTNEVGILLTKNDTQRLNLEPLAFLAKFRLEYARYQNSVDYFHYEASSALKNVLENIPPKGTKVTEPSWQQAYNAIMPKI